MVRIHPRWRIEHINPRWFIATTESNIFDTNEIYFVIGAAIAPILYIQPFPAQTTINLNWYLWIILP